MQIVDGMRRGRVFLAGDAAHLNPPFGGHGLNTGLGDAVDLGWKLAATLDGWGGPALLDSYQIERRPIQERVICEATANMAVTSPELLADNLDADDEAGERARSGAHGSADRRDPAPAGIEGQQGGLLVARQVLQHRARGDLRVALPERRDQLDVILLAPRVLPRIRIQAAPADPDIALRGPPQRAEDADIPVGGGRREQREVKLVMRGRTAATDESTRCLAFAPASRFPAPLPMPTQFIILVLAVITYIG